MFDKGKKAASEEAASVFRRPLLVTINGKPAELVETIEQFAWFASAFRSVGNNPTALSLVDFRVISKPSESQGLVTKLTLLPLRSCVNTDPSYGSCWMSLVPFMALAWGFPIKERGQAVGLEIPVQGMLKACGTLAPTGFKDNIIIRRDPFTKYPIASHHDGVQWHVVIGTLEALFEKSKAFLILPLEDDIFLFYSRGYIMTGNNVNSIKKILG